MKKITILFIAAVIAIAFTACKSGGSNELKSYKLKTTDDSVAYAIGAQIAMQMQLNSLKQTDSNINFMALAKAMYEMYQDGKLSVDEKEIEGVLMRKFNPEVYQQGLDNEKKGKAFLEKNAKKAGVKTTASGLQYEVITEGTGPKPTATDNVKVHYTGTLLDGTVFDSSVERGEPVEFPLGQVIKGWTEGLQLMPVGSKYKFYVPADLAYGASGQPQGGIGPNEPLIFEVELLSIEKAKEPQFSQEDLQKMIEQQAAAGK
ncbi:MAG: FKBP-type peptidyl-prolyl cis-trans isomerase [Chitinophagales bacterium]|nr:FKBP-type peptidyl-prolyl cis-trans isomerase [Chitinophagales bacterium]